MLRAVLLSLGCLLLWFNACSRGLVSSSRGLNTRTRGLGAALDCLQIYD